LSFLQFDHIGGINTLLHTLFNRGVVVTPSGRTPELVIDDIQRFGVELLPTTPTFLRMMLLSGLLEERAHDLRTLRVVTYGTERMDQASLDAIAAALPAVDLRQTYGMSELGILRVKSRSRNSLWMRIGGEGVSTRVVDGILHIRADHRMMGYLNAPDPFVDGWYNTRDLVEKDGEDLRITGRANEIINIAGMKVLPGEVERVALMHQDVAFASARGVPNPITGQHIEVLCEPRTGKQLDKAELRKHFAQHLPAHFVPHRIQVGAVAATYRFKRAAGRRTNHE
jgi:acyl-CoA synthetase (AMP-forming)/AMP-acid ligase II